MPSHPSQMHRTQIHRRAAFKFRWPFPASKVGEKFMTNKKQSGIFVLVFAMGLTGCEGGTPVSPTPTAPIAPLPSPVSASPTLIVFTEPGTGFSTSELHDVHEQVLQLNTANELIWTADGTRLPGYRAGCRRATTNRIKRTVRFCQRLSLACDPSTSSKSSPCERVQNLSKT